MTPPSRQIGFRGLEHQVVMIVQEHVATHPPTEARRGLGQQRQPTAAVPVSGLDHASFDAAPGDMIPSARPLNAQWTSHGQTLPQNLHPVNSFVES